MTQEFLLEGGPLAGDSVDIEDKDTETECFRFSKRVDENIKWFYYCRNQQGKPILEFEESFTK